MRQEFFRYIFKNMIGMIAVSVYVVADTFFISKCSGADGITFLNLALPLYGVLYAIGSMIGIGTAIYYAIQKEKGEADVNSYFFNAIAWQAILSVSFVLIGLFCPQLWIQWMGGDAQIIALGRSYIRIVLIGAPVFLWHYTFEAFVRNDGKPTIAMIAMLASSLFNIVFDYVFMFPMKMGITGAGLATTLAPMVSISICARYLLGKKSGIDIYWSKPSVRLLVRSSYLGISAFVAEISGSVITIIFNFLLLKQVGNIGIAAYGVIANWSMVVVSLFNGLGQGMQPLLSRAYGQADFGIVRKILRMGEKFALLMEGLIILLTWCFTDFFVQIFNSEQNQILADYATKGMRLYFLGFLAAGLNIVLITYFSATNQGFPAMVASLLRGLVVIGVCAIVMGTIWGVTGVWLSFLVAESITLVVVLFFLVEGNVRRAQKMRL